MNLTTVAGPEHHHDRVERVLHLLPDLQRSFAQRLGLLVFPALAVQHGQVVERGGDGRVIFPQSFLSDGQRVIQQVSRLFILILIPGRTHGNACDDGEVAHYMFTSDMSLGRAGIVDRNGDV